MVERIAAAVREDGVPVGAILALTFTEKAAGELAERLRRRLTELGEHEHARAVDGAWIGTIHGFCARLLRSQPLAAGLDPRFEVLEESAAERLANASYERALEAWARAEGAAAIDLAASYGAALRELVQTAYATLRARGHEQPRLVIPPTPPAPDADALAAAREAAARELATAGDGMRVAAARAALDACASCSVRRPPRGRAVAGRAGAAELKGGARALTTEPCEAYRERVARVSRRVRGLPREHGADAHRRPARPLRRRVHARQARARRGRLRRPRAARQAPARRSRRRASDGPSGSR